MNKVVETAIDEKGRSYLVSEELQEGWALPGHTITDLFSAVTEPKMDDSVSALTDKNFNLNPGEIRFIRSDIEPTREVFESLAREERPENMDELFYHSTTTIDYFVVTRGELTLLVGNSKVKLKQGDAIIQRGAAHAWHNYGQSTASIMGVMVGVEPPAQFPRIDTVQPD
ncbi:cupin domain-containing protein [Dongshaea marina]|uniref:cupin domain-containing protein n=1 Tax=Dongshaea marina TaxID=2047966 RepID=UPI000D3E3DF1|nr:cupin domain-containing protein [Dongshaea marina]